MNKNVYVISLLVLGRKKLSLCYKHEQKKLNSFSHKKLKFNPEHRS